MSSDDLTENLPDTPTTEPTIETLLNRINAIGEQLSGEIQSVRGEMQSMSGEMQSLKDEVQSMSGEIQSIKSEIQSIRTDMKTGFHRVERKIEILNDNILTVQANNRDLLVRVEDLESKAS